jgi:NAD(P)-dependent dehydrogenase (short-subunit alcohol dehydrogenase family)
MDLRLNGKRAMVTGSSSGIGAAIAAALAAEGARVVVHGRDADRTEAVAAGIRGDGGEARAVLGDLTTDAGAEHAASRANELLGAVDILINVAGGTGDDSFTWNTTGPGQWVEQFELNTISAVRMIGHLAGGMTRNGWGRIIQIGSIAANLPLPHQVPAYCASKAALPVLAVSLAKTLAGTGVTVNTVTLGYVETPLLRRYALNQPGARGRAWEEIAPDMVEALGIAAGRFGLPGDAAAMVAFLSSPLADWITGANVRVDGGQCGFVN